MGELISIKEYKEREWHDRVEGYAKLFSDQMKMSFVEQRQLAQSSRKEFKMTAEEQIEFQLYEVNIFFDYLISTMTSIMCFSANDSLETEGIVLDQVHKKFEMIRQIKKQNEEAK